MKDLNKIFRLDGKVIVITGAAGLLGRKHAEAIVAFGGIPVLLDINPDLLYSFADELTKKSEVDCFTSVVDITKEEEIKNNCAEVMNQYGKIDGLILNAARNPQIEKSAKENFTRIENFPIDTWNDDISVGLTGAFLCSKHYGKAISNNSDGGSIIAISSDLGLISPDQRLYETENTPDSLQSVKPITYSVVKTGLIGLTRYLSTYWSQSGVRVNAICPGGVENNQPKEFVDRLITRIPLGRMARVDEYQGTIVWMLSDASSYLNGAVIPIDGGRTTW